MEKSVLGVIIGNRGVFPGSLAEGGRREVVNILKKEGVETVLVASKDTKYGAIENLSEAKKCAELFRRNREKIEGILVSLPNFGDERAIADAQEATRVLAISGAFHSSRTTWASIDWGKLLKPTTNLLLVTKPYPGDPQQDRIC